MYRAENFFLDSQGSIVLVGGEAYDNRRGEIYEQIAICCAAVRWTGNAGTPQLPPQVPRGPSEGRARVSW
jgi:hypothetical protein